MGKVLSILTKPIKNYNIESRAHKVISKEKPVPAPRHKGVMEEAERILKENPESMNELLRKDPNLDNRLKNVYVTSHDPMIETKQKASLERSLPLNRKIHEPFEFGFEEPSTIQIGKCTLKQAINILTKHQEDPVTWNSTKFAIDYKKPEEKIRHILDYFRVYKVHIPEKRPKVLFAEPSVPKRRFMRENTTEKLIENDKKKL